MIEYRFNYINNTTTQNNYYNDILRLKYYFHCNIL